MIHTIQITRRLTLAKFNNIVGNLFTPADMSAFLEGGYPLVASPYYPGINEVEFSRAGDEYLSLSFVINPQTLASGAYTIDLFTCTDEAIQLLEETFATALDALGLSPFLPITEWYPRRID